SPPRARAHPPPLEAIGQAVVSTAVIVNLATDCISQVRLRTLCHCIRCEIRTVIQIPEACMLGGHIDEWTEACQHQGTGLSSTARRHFIDLLLRARTSAGRH